jgi:hypothetical protein
LTLAGKPSLFGSVSADAPTCTDHHALTTRDNPTVTQRTGHATPCPAPVLIAVSFCVRLSSARVTVTRSWKG